MKEAVATFQPRQYLADWLAESLTVQERCCTVMAGSSFVQQIDPLSLPAEGKPGQEGRLQRDPPRVGGGRQLAGCQCSSRLWMHP